MLTTMFLNWKTSERNLTLNWQSLKIEYLIDKNVKQKDTQSVLTLFLRKGKKKFRQ